MATMDYWAEAPMNREQMALFAPTLDSMISEDDPVRLVDEVLAGIDWSSWEGEYHGKRGQPPIHPSPVAKSKARTPRRTRLKFLPPTQTHG